MSSVCISDTHDLKKYDVCLDRDPRWWPVGGWPQAGHVKEACYSFPSLRVFLVGEQV